MSVETRVDDDGMVHVRRPESPDIPDLLFDADEWTAFLAGVKAGEFDPLVEGR